MNILVIGSLAREHAICLALKKSLQRPTLFCYGTTFNPGIAPFTAHYKVGDMGDADSIIHFARALSIDLAIIGPEAPLAIGLANLLSREGIGVIGPTQKLAQIEVSKAFARNLMQKYGISGAPLYKVFGSLEGVKPFLEVLGDNNYVIKANGLMGGKGVKVAGEHLHSVTEAYHFCETLYQAGHTFLIEEKLIGQEFSQLNFCDGRILVPMPLIQDHKRAYIQDKGPNTGGMGSYSDSNHLLPFITDQDRVEAQRINEAVLNALQEECGEKYKGILYGSFIATREGVRLIEYNARFGDPEVLNLLSILESDLVAICDDIIHERLLPQHVRFAHNATVCKYAVPLGYPDQPLINETIDVSQVEDTHTLYYGGVNQHNGKLVATGARAIAVVGVGTTIAAAESIAENEIQRLRGKLFHREDIGTTTLINHRIAHMRALRA